jgi:hypothetical protein
MTLEESIDQAAAKLCGVLSAVSAQLKHGRMWRIAKAVLPAKVNINWVEIPSSDPDSFRFAAATLAKDQPIEMSGTMGEAPHTCS